METGDAESSCDYFDVKEMLQELLNGLNLHFQRKLLSELGCTGNGLVTK